MPKGGARPGAGRKAGGKNKATIEREILAAQRIDAARRGQRRLAVDEMEKALQIAQGFASANQPEPIRDTNGRVIQLKGGDIELFGDWFDRWTFLLKELAKYQSPQVKAIEAGFLEFVRVDSWSCPDVHVGCPLPRQFFQSTGAPLFTGS